MKNMKTCKVCGGQTSESFRIPGSKKTGHEIPDAPDDCIYYECEKCGFCFTDILDKVENSDVYDEDYWKNQDPDWYGRVSETMRLVMMGNMLLNTDPWKLEILDFGSGMGTFVETARKLGFNVWGHDIIEPEFGKEYFLKKLPRDKFDIIVSCEVIEHLPFPVETLQEMIQSLKQSGVFAFQTAHYDSGTCGREWWYVGPGNGHVSLYSKGAFDYIYKKFGGEKRLLWNNYPGVQAWQLNKNKFTGRRAEPGNDASQMENTQDLSVPSPAGPVRTISKACDAADFFDPEYIRVLTTDLQDNPALHRKQWEFTMIFMALKKIGMLSSDKVGLSMGSGIERVLYAVAREVKHLTVTDLYGITAAWDCANADNPVEFVRKNKPFPVDNSRFTALHMDMRKLDFRKESFDFAYSACALEHIGTGQDFLTHLDEVYKVLKDGGVYVFTTEFVFEEETIKVKNNYLFSAKYLDSLIGRSRFIAEPVFNARVSEQSANFPLPGQIGNLNFMGGHNFVHSLHSAGIVPHIQLLWGKHVYTSCVFVLKKDRSQSQKRPIVFDGLSESISFFHSLVNRYREMIRQPLSLNPFGYIQGGKSRFFSGYGIEPVKSSSDDIFHSEYYWMGGGHRNFNVFMKPLEFSRNQACSVELRVHRYKTSDQSVIDCNHSENIVISGDQVEKSISVNLDDDYAYAVLGIMKTGTCIFSEIRIDVSAPVDPDLSSVPVSKARQSIRSNTAGGKVGWMLNYFRSHAK